MKNLSLFLFVIVCISCQQTNHIYIVRHAEKGDEPKSDVYLSPAGRQRANVLKTLLQHKRLEYIFSTKTNRTRETVTPISSETGVPINVYGNDTLGKFVKSILKLKKNMLIVGHSNTVLTMLDSMHVEHSVKNISDDEYDNLFIVSQKNGKVTGLKETTYGRPSPHTNPGKTMK